nr:LuxR family transcriptional regulator [Actinacidiphila guanduensis]
MYGPAGIGKTTLLTTLAAAETARGTRVLRCSPAPADAELPYLGIIDLLARVPREILGQVPPGLREALPIAVLHGRGAAGRPNELAIRLAVLEVLHLLAAMAPVLVVVDGLQWLDEQSAAVVAFAARRIEGDRIAVAAAERTPEGGRPAGARLCPPGSAEFAVPPLPDEEVARLLQPERLPAPVLRAVIRTAAGNPYYARELARHTASDTLPAESGGLLPVPEELRTLLTEPLDRLPPGARDTLLLAAAAEHPTLPLLQAAGLPDTAAALAEAARAGLAGTDAAQAVHLVHPLLRAAVYDAAPAHERRAAHGRLAAAATDPAEAARQLALARPYEDAATSAALMTAARAARERGEPGTAAELAELAVRRTPVHQAAERDRRLVQAADFACDAGRWGESERAAGAVLAHSADAHCRVRARLVLLRTAGQALRDHGELIEDGLRDAAGAPGLEAALHHWAAVRGLLTGALDEAALNARRSARCAAAAEDPGLRIAALSTLARVRALAGETEAAERALEQAMELAAHLPDSGPQSRGLIRMQAVLALDSDRVAQAGRQLTELLAADGESDGVEATMAALVALTRVQVRAGDCGQARRTAARCMRIAAEARMASAPALYVAALAEAYGGSAAEARELALRAVRASEEDGDQLFLLRASAALGQAGLFSGERALVAEAVEALRRVVRIGVSMGAADPPLLGWYADLAEALAVLGETEAAGEVLGQASARAAGPGRAAHAPAAPPTQAAKPRATAHTAPTELTALLYASAGHVPGSVLASLERAAGLQAAARGELAEGAALLRASAGRLRGLELPVDLARTLIALGTVERRARHKTAARELLAEALRLAEGAGAAPFAERAAAELARVDGQSPDGQARLTPAEARVAELVRGGATNREVAAELFISVKTVEGTLSRLYRRFGVRSRTALVHAMASATPRWSQETHP